METLVAVIVLLDWPRALSMEDRKFDLLSSTPYTLT